MTKVARNYNIGDKFRMSSDALDNYGQNYTDKVFTVRQWYDHVGEDTHGHRGFDESAGTAIYGSELNFDLYEWEMVKVSR